MNRSQKQPEQDELSRRLRALPLVSAPPSLACDVMAVIERRRASAWWARPLMNWPTGARWAVQTAGVVLAVLLVWFGGEALRMAVDALVDPLLAGLKPLKSALGTLAAVGWRLGGLAATRASWTVMACAAAGVLAIYVSSLGLGTVFWRVVTTRD